MRNAAYGFSLATLLRGPFARRAIAAQLVIDETTAMARAQEDEDAARGAFWLTGAAVFVCWNAGTLAGALAGSGLGDPAKYGLDAMFPAAFLALLAPQLRQEGAVAAAIAGAVIALVLLPFTPPGVPVIAASLGRAGRPAEALVSWAALLALAAGSYALKAAGPLLLGEREPSPRVARVLALLAVPLLSALIVVQTLSDGERRGGRRPRAGARRGGDLRVARRAVPRHRARRGRGGRGPQSSLTSARMSPTDVLASPNSIDVFSS